MKNKNKIIRSFIFMIMVLVITGMELKAQDWPQWRGNDREGIFKATGLNLDWSEKKPALSWTFRQAGSGYSAPTILGTTLYSQGAEEGNDFAFALDTKTGNLKWKQTLGEQYTDGQNRGNGGRGSITTDGDKLYLVRGGGQIHCLSAADGKILWQKEFIKDFGGKLMSNWGFSESPLIDGNVVICTPGGNEGTLAALDKNTGAVVWRSKAWTDDSGYSSAIVVEVDGVKQYIQQAAKGVAGVAVEDGKLLWRVEIPGYRTAIIPTPIYKDHIVFVTDGYSNSCTAIRIEKDGDVFKSDVIYTNKVMGNQHGGVVLINGFIYGHSNTSGWVCQSFETGETAWTQRSNEAGKGCVLAVNDRLLCLNEQTGLLTIVAASPDAWKEFGSMPIPERTTIVTANNMVWTHPVVANGNLYLRDHDLLFCFDLKK